MFCSLSTGGPPLLWHGSEALHLQDLEKIRQDIARSDARLKAAREAASKSLAAQRETEQQLQAYVEYVRKLRAVPAPS